MAGQRRGTENTLWHVDFFRDAWNWWVRLCTRRNGAGMGAGVALLKSRMTHPPNPGCIVFVGSSSIRFWDTLVSDMKPLDVINRGFGGSQFSDLDQYADRLVVAYHPRAVVVYE